MENPIKIEMSIIPQIMAWMLEFLQTQNQKVYGLTEAEVVSKYILTTLNAINREVKIFIREEQDAIWTINTLLGRSKFEQSSDDEPEEEETLPTQEVSIRELTEGTTLEDYSSLMFDDVRQPAVVQRAEKDNDDDLRLAIAHTFRKVGRSLWNSSILERITLDLYNKIKEAKAKK